MKPNKPWLEPDWPAPPNVHAATTLRIGGVSTGLYDSLNPALHVGDDPALVNHNRNIIKAMLDLPSEPYWLNQVHSNIAVEADLKPAPVTADASFTYQPGVVCVVLTADCLPLLVTTKDGDQIGAIHAGWRGLLEGVITQTIAAFSTRDLLVWLGPAIGPNQFEVGSEIRTAFVNQSADFTAAFTPKADGKYLADIYRLARINLNQLGIGAIYGGDYCTVSDSERFYSYRRDNITGRIATLIWRD